MDKIAKELRKAQYNSSIKHTRLVALESIKKMCLTHPNEADFLDRLYDFLLLEANKN